MGHIRLGTLPQTRRWREVVDLVAEGADVARVADATARAADRAFAAVQNDPGFSETVWLLTQLAVAAKQANPTAHLESVGLALSAQTSIPELALAIGNALDARIDATRQRSDFGEIAQNAVVGSVVEHIDRRLGTLLTPTSADVHAALAALGRKSEFGKLARTFFARLTSESLRYFLTKTLGTKIGEGQRFVTNDQVARFQDALDTHCREAAEIVEKFSADWFSKTRFEGQGNIAKEKSEGFGWYAMQKLRDELRKRTTE